VSSAVARAGEWEPEADNWVRWARTPGHDAYWYYRHAFFGDLLPAVGRRTLEIGCGEGRVARDLAGRGHRVVAVDTSLSLLRRAQGDGGGIDYVLADGAALPFADASFDVVVAYNSLQVVKDMHAAVSEAARVLQDGGKLCLCVSHPVTDLGRFDGEDDDADFVLRPRYFETERVEDTIERDGLTMTFRGWTHSLEGYFVALEDAGLQVEVVREPRPADPPARYRRYARLPMFMNLRAGKAVGH